MLYTADFETTTDPNDCRVWATGIHEIGGEGFYYGNNIEYFFNFAKTKPDSTFYYHNLKFDGVFLIHYLFSNGYKHVLDKKQLKKKTFCTLISDKGQYYSIEIMFGKGEKTTILDSMKLLPFSVEQIAKGFDLDVGKVEVEQEFYTRPRKIGHILDEEEVYYLKNDVKVVAQALQILIEQGIDKMTLGSSAMAEYKKLVGGKKFLKWFPPPVYDGDIRQSYKGGFTYCDPRTQGKDLGEGLVLDVNSLYPSVMYYSPLPYGEGISFDGEYKYDKVYNLYVVMITCQFELKENKIPTIQLKNNLSFVPTAYLESSEGEEVSLCLTSVDLELFFEHYEVYNLEYHGGWKFKSTTGLFKDYIDKWNGIKVQATIDGNESMRTLAKLMLNNIYGKFALNPRVQSKIPFLKDGIVKYRLGDEETREPIYIPVGSFITAYARHKTITSAQKMYDNFAYADTDSLHLYCSEGETVEELLERTSKVLDVDGTQLGAWKLEGFFTRARFVRQKTYTEEIDGKLHITCAGMPKRCYEHVTWDNFKKGTSYAGKLQFTHVKGGVVLLDTQFTLKG